jgi:hypothetical protein
MKPRRKKSAKRIARFFDSVSSGPASQAAYLSGMLRLVFWGRVRSHRPVSSSYIFTAFFTLLCPAEVCAIYLRRCGLT